MIVWLVALAAGIGAAYLARRAHVTRSILFGWAIVAAFASATVARTLLAPDGRLQAATAIVPDFPVPSDVLGLQGTNSLDTIVPQKDGSIVLGGWIVDERTHAAGSGMYLDIDGTSRIAGPYGGARPDVARAMHAPAAMKSGFTVTLKPGQLQPGAHRIRLGIIVGNERFESVRRYAVMP